MIRHAGRTSLSAVRYPVRIFQAARAYRLFMVMVLILMHGLAPAAFSEPASPPDARVVRVHDGDTVTIMMGRRRTMARLIGIDAPEMGQRPWGKRARERLVAIMKQCNWTVRVETDVVDRDKYDRLLVYLRTGDGRLVNEMMLRDGYAVLFTIPPNVTHADVFTRAQQDARTRSVGIWGPKGLKEPPVEYRKQHPRKDMKSGDE